MTLTIEIKPKIKARIFAEASANNLSVEEFVQRIVENNFVENSFAEVSIEEFERNLDLLAEGTANFSSRYNGTHSREDIYLDHD
jgi:hypothetical protein